MSGKKEILKDKALLVVECVITENISYSDRKGRYVGMSGSENLTFISNGKVSKTIIDKVNWAQKNPTKYEPYEYPTNPSKKGEYFSSEYTPKRDYPIHIFSPYEEGNAIHEWNRSEGCVVFGNLKNKDKKDYNKEADKMFGEIKDIVVNRNEKIDVSVKVRDERSQIDKMYRPLPYKTTEK